MIALDLIGIVCGVLALLLSTWLARQGRLWGRLDIALNLLALACIAWLAGALVERIW